MTPNDFIDLMVRQAKSGEQLHFDFKGKAVVPFGYTLNLADARKWLSVIKKRMAKKNVTFTVLWLDSVTCTVYGQNAERRSVSSMHFQQWFNTADVK